MASELQNSDNSHDTVVIGGGIVGMSCALFLQRDGRRVTVIDPAVPGSSDQASFGNAGSISSSSVLPTALPGIYKKIPGMLADPTGPLAIQWRYLLRLTPFLLSFLRYSSRGHVEESGRAIAAIIHRVYDAYQILLEETGTRDLVVGNGSLKVFKTDQSFAATAFERELLEQNDCRYEVLNEDELRQLEPALQPIFKHAIFMPDSSTALNPGKIVSRFAEHFVAKGGTIVRAEARDIRFADGVPRTVVTTNGDFDAGTIVLAAGAWSGDMARRLGAPVLLEAERGYHIMLPKPPVMPQRFITFPDRKFAILPHQDGLRVTTGIEYAKVDAPPDYRRIRRMMPFADESIRDLDTTEQSIWLGRRPTLPNSVPVIGHSPRHRNVLLAFGHSHLGLTMGPATGQIIADLAAGRDPGLDLTPYRPDR
jgi:D-amino-acid dehydrogenase